LYFGTKEVAVWIKMLVGFRRNEQSKSSILDLIAANYSSIQVKKTLIVYTLEQTQPW
jgi:hypothetical protein